MQSSGSSSLQRVRSVLIIKQSSLGDVIHTLPVVHALKRRHPEMKLGWVVQRGYADLLAADPAIDVVHPIHIPSTSDPMAGRNAYLKALSATWRTWFTLRRVFSADPYQKVLDLHASFRSGLLALANPGGTRIGFAGARECNPWFMHEQVNNPENREHALLKNLLFAEYLGCPARKDDFFLAVSRKAREEVDSLLAERGLRGDARLLYFHATARWQSKFWQVEKWAELATRLGADGYAPLFGGTREDAAYIERIGSVGGAGAVASIAGRLSLAGVAALLQRCIAYVGLDSGPMHMAAMLGIPVVALFGPTHPEKVGPYGVASRIVQADGLDCLCCRKRQCDHAACMQGISVRQVHSHLLSLLESRR